ncbi:MAG: TIGR03085 family metal-binding protein [Candidatus Nanopelagicales bacterium]
MSAQQFAQSERHSLADLLDELGPEAPTLCAGWTTRDLTAHLLIREDRPDAALGILGGPLASYTESVQNRAADRPFADNVDRVRNGPSAFSIFRIPGIDGAVNLMEYLVHHEDVRRASDDWQPRVVTDEEQDLVWSRLSRLSRLMVRKVPVGVVLRRSDTNATIIARKGTPIVEVEGLPVELALRLYGREAVNVTYTGSPEDIAAFNASPMGA